MTKPLSENWTTGDISGFGFAFTLVLLATILSAYTDHPVFWLLVDRVAGRWINPDYISAPPIHYASRISRQVNPTRGCKGDADSFQNSCRISK